MQWLGRLRKSSLTALFGYALLALVAVWLIGNFAQDPEGVHPGRADRA